MLRGNDGLYSETLPSGSLNQKSAHASAEDNAENDEISVITPLIHPDRVGTTPLSPEEIELNQWLEEAIASFGTKAGYTDVEEGNNISNIPKEEGEGKDDPIVEQKQGWLSWAANGVYQAAVSVKNAAVSVKNMAVQVVTHPVQSLFDLLKSPRFIVGALGLGTSGQPAINAALDPSGTSAKDISLDTYMAMSPWHKIATIVNLMSSLIVNYPLNRDFIKEAAHKVMVSAKEMITGVLPFFKNMGFIYLAMMAGFTAGILAQEAFSFVATDIAALDFLIPMTMAGLSGLITSAARYLGSKKSATILSSLVSHDAAVQRKAVDALRHLNPHVNVSANAIAKYATHKREKYARREEANTFETIYDEATKGDAAVEMSIKQLIQLRLDKKAAHLLQEKLSFNDTERAALFKDYDQGKDYVIEKALDLLKAKHKLDDLDYEKLFKKLLGYTSKLEGMHVGDDTLALFNKKKMSKSILDNAALYGYPLLAFIPAFSAWLLFTQKTIDGFDALSNGALREDIDSDIYLSGIGALGASGTAALLLYLSAGREFLQLVVETLPGYLYRNPKQIPYLLAMTTFNYFASSSLHRVSTSAFEKPDFIFSAITTHIIARETMAYLVQAGAFTINILPVLRPLRPQPEDHNQPTIDELLQYHEDPCLHPISTFTAEDCAAKLRGLSFFDRKERVLAHKHEHEESATSSRENSYSDMGV